MEVNFDGLVGPTHNYSGLAFGNVASANNSGLASSPKRAALQGLEKMRKLYELGVKQAILPPQPRPALALLRQFYSRPWHNTEFSPVNPGLSDAELITQTAELNPRLLSAFSSAACMWTANAATVSPSADCSDSHVHFTAANLSTGLHRSIEADFTYNILKQIFGNTKHFTVHSPYTSNHGDEGAANHCRFTDDYTKPGIELFVYGHEIGQVNTKRYPSRQSLSASQLTAHEHKVRHSVFAQQNPDAIDAGVFHNDVISTSNLNVFLYHELAFTNTEAVIEELQQKWAKLKHGKDLHLIKATNDELSLDDAVKSYLYNSQLISTKDGMVLIAPLEAHENPNSRAHIEKILAAENPIVRAEYLDLRESMRNGGGPACLRLRVALTEIEFNAIKQSVIFTERLYEKLKQCINEYYRDELSPSDLSDPKFIEEAQEAGKQIYSILNLELL